MSRLQKSKWLKFDFHTHTPGSNDFRSGNHSIRPEDWLKKAMEKKLDCVVVTDHNSGSWLDKLKEKMASYQDPNSRPDWFRELTIFPGVEITVADSERRIHLLAIFDLDFGTENVSAVLGSCRINSGFGDERETSTTTSFIETVDAIEDAGGIAIPAHIDGKKGLLEKSISLTPELKKSLQKVKAAEFCDINKFDHVVHDLQKIINNLAKVKGSDAHKLEDIGRNFSWIKMGKPSLDGLQWALRNHVFNIKNQPQDPNRDPQIFLSKLSIKNMHHCGRIINDPFCIELHPLFNSIIGGRGAGKSTVLESIRIASRLDEKLKIEARKIHEDLENFMGLEPHGIMLKSTEIILELQRNKTKYRLNWTFGGNGPVLEERNKKGDWIKTEAGDLGRFKISLFSQKQINALASNSKGLLELVDNSPEINRATWKSRWDSNNNKFLQTRIQKRDLIRQLNEEHQIRAELVDVEDDLKQYEKTFHEEVLKRYQKRNQQNNGLPNNQIFDYMSSEIRRIVSELDFPEFPEHLFDKDDATVSEIRNLHVEYDKKLAKILTKLIEVAEAVDELKSSKKKKIKKSKWYQELEVSNQAYKELTSKIEVINSQLSITRYGELVSNRGNLQSKLKNFDNFRKELEVIEAQDLECQKKSESLRHELYENRKSFINKVIGTSSYVRMEVIKYGDKDNLENNIREIFGLDNKVFRSELLDVEAKGGILWKLYSEKDSNLFEKHISDLKTRIHDVAKGNVNGLNGHFINRLKQILKTNPEKFDHLDAWWPEDLLIVKYSKNNLSSQFENLEKGSAGQKAAAILAFLLSHGEGPLIIDQPEDDLDNALIYDLIVKQIRTIKYDRQLIIVTHNPNIVVNGDAELVHVLKFTDGQIKLDKQGGLEEKEIRDTVCNIMEGGQQAFENRYNRIMQKDTRDKNYGRTFKANPAR